MGKKSRGERNEIRRRKREKYRLKRIALRNLRRIERGRRAVARQMELAKRMRARIVKEAKEAY